MSYWRSSAHRSCAVTLSASPPPAADDLPRRSASRAVPCQRSAQGSDAAAPGSSTRRTPPVMPAPLTPSVSSVVPSRTERALDDWTTGGGASAQRLGQEGRADWCAAEQSWSGSEPRRDRQPRWPGRGWQGRYASSGWEAELAHDVGNRRMERALTAMPSLSSSPRMRSVPQRVHPRGLKCQAASS